MTICRSVSISLAALLPLLAATEATAEPVTWRSVSVLDTLGPATTDTTFSIFGSSGFPIFGPHGFGTQLVGPRFTLEHRSVLTSVGGFVNSCEQIATCDAGSPFTVQIRPAIEMNPEYGPDPSTLIASFTMSHDRDPRVVSFESASFHLPLGKGTYYALFGLPPGEGGAILDSAMFPFPYRAPETTFGIMDPGAGFSINENLHGAMRITASAPAPVPEPSTWMLLFGGLAAAALMGRRTRTATP